MAQFTMPLAREFGWNLKPTASTQFEIIKKANGQFGVVLNHSLLRGVTSEMIAWWFRNFPSLKVKLEDTPGYEGKLVDGYLLWHPSDHRSAELKGTLGPDGTAQAGATIAIREAMQHDTYGMKYPVDAELEIFYCADDGWAMGKSLPLFGKVMCLRIHFADVVEEGLIVGVHYHYEIVIGASADNFVTRALNRKITGDYSSEFFEAWHLHNTIEVGTFENFLPALYAQSQSGRSGLRYALDMDPIGTSTVEQTAHSPGLFEERVAGYRRAEDLFAYQAAESASFL